MLMAPKNGDDSLRPHPAKPGQVSEKNVAKNTKKQKLIRERVREIEDNSKQLKVKGKATVLQQEVGAPLCDKRPFKGRPKVPGRGKVPSDTMVIGRGAPGDETWTKLQALKGSLINTGKLPLVSKEDSLRWNPVEPGGVSQKNVAKKAEKRKPFGDIEIEVNSKQLIDNGKQLRAKGKHSTVSHQEVGVALCDKCPFKGQPKADDR